MYRRYVIWDGMVWYDENSRMHEYTYIVSSSKIESWLCFCLSVGSLRLATRKTDKGPARFYLHSHGWHIWCHCFGVIRSLLGSSMSSFVITSPCVEVHCVEPIAMEIRSLFISVDTWANIFGTATYGSDLHIYGNFNAILPRTAYSLLDSAEGLLFLGHVQPSFLSFNCCEVPPRFEQLLLHHPGLGREVKLCDPLHWMVETFVSSSKKPTKLSTFL